MISKIDNLEARAIIDGEQELFLAQMCQVFGLDIDGARPIFYNDPFFDLSHKRVLFDNGSNRIISSLTVVPAEIRISGGGIIKAAGIAGVCTVPDLRRHGYAKRLLRETLVSVSKEFGYAAAALLTDSPDVYRSIGFEICSSVNHWSMRRRDLPTNQNTANAAPVTLANEAGLIDEIRHLYDVSSRAPGVFLRRERRWSIISQAYSRNDILTWRDDGVLTGCLLYRTRKRDREQILDIIELLASTEAAAKGLIAAVQKLRTIVTVTGQSDSAFLETTGLRNIPGVRSSQRPGVMMALIDIEACLESVAATGVAADTISNSKSGLTIRLENCVFPTGKKPIRLFAIKNGIAMAPADEIIGDWISLDSGAMTQLFFGFKSATSLHTEGRIRISSDDALTLTDSIFPKYDTFLGQLDAF
jgi:predicted acetyltransferase